MTSCQINEIHAATGAGIVFSTSWRLSWTTSQLKAILRNAGLNESVPIYGSTPILRVVDGKLIETNGVIIGNSPTPEIFVGTSRWQEIAAWLDQRPDVESYCVTDDVIDADCPPSRAVECVWGVGLSKERAARAIDILNGETL